MQPGNFVQTTASKTIIMLVREKAAVTIAVPQVIIIFAACGQYVIRV